MRKSPIPQRPTDARARRGRLNELPALATLLVLVVVAAIALTGAAAASTAKPPQSPSYKKPGAVRPERCPDARKALSFYRQQWARWVRLRGVKVTLPKTQPKGCGLVRAKVEQEQHNAAKARRRYQTWLADTRVLRERERWLDAVQEAQKAYPGSSAWLRSCSASEGGWGRWVANTQGSGAGGWLQFLHGTFSGFNRHALADVKSRGFQHPRSAESWYSPLGQALAGGWAYKRGLTYHWYGGGC